MEVEEGLERLSAVLKVCNAYQDCFFKHKEKLQSFQVVDNCHVPDWNFDPMLVFARLWRFLQHLETLQVIILCSFCQKKASHTVAPVLGATLWDALVIPVYVIVTNLITGAVFLL